MVLETTIKRFIGSSADRKPTVGLQPDDSGPDSGRVTVPRDLPAGSTFFEEDTGDIWRWNGHRWTLPASDRALEHTLTKALAALHLEVMALRLGMIEVGQCKDIKKSKLL